MSGLVRAAAKNPLFVFIFAAGIIVAGIFAATRMPIDAVPDVTNVQVQVVTSAPALSATEVETQITQPIERAMAGTPGLSQIRSTTRLGISVVTLVFRDDVDTYFARAQVSERLVEVRDQIPPDVGRPELGPISTGLGEIYMFELRSTTPTERSGEELRTIVEWQVAPRLRQLKGVIEVVAFGGASKQYRVTLDPARLAAHGISVDEVRQALERDNAVAGGGYIEQNSEQVVLRGDARFRGIEDIASTVVRTDAHGLPLLVGQLGVVGTGPSLRQGAMTRDGRGEIVGGSVLMLKGENSREVVVRLKQAIDELKPHLPAGVIIDPYYDRADFINRVLATVSKNLTEGAGLVVLCLLVTLGTLRAGLLVAGAIPFAMLVGILGLSAIGYTGNVMSLGAIDFGIVVEGAVVVVEHVLSHLGQGKWRSTRRSAIVHAMEEVARPVLFGVVIVVLVFLPLATLEDVEGKMFRPVVFSLCFMLFGALLYALVIVPALAPRLFGDVKSAKDPMFVRWLRRVYEPVLDAVVVRPRATIAVTFAIGALLLGIGGTLGAEFLPRIFEGSFAIDAQRPPSTSLTQAIALAKETENALKTAPEVETVINRIGRPENSVDPAGAESSDIFVILKNRNHWRHGMTPEKLAQDLSARVDKAVPATVNAFTQPIEMRVNDLLAGVKGDVSVKVFGEDLNEMTDAADKIRRALSQIKGAADVKMDLATGLPAVTVAVDRSRASRLGISPRSILDVLAMTRAGEKVGRVREGERVFDLVLRIGGEEIKAERDLTRLPIATHDGALVPLAQVANISQERTVAQIGREQMRRRLVVQSNVRGRDVVGFVNEARARVDALKLPETVELVWGGQFQSFNRAKGRLTLLVPVALAVIALLLAITYRNLRYTLVTALSLPFAIAGGVAALVARGLPFSIPAGVGLIALCGVSVMNGVVMTSHLQNRPSDEPPEQRVRTAALMSLRAIASTALVAAVGFVPAAIATGMGAEVQRPLATVVIGGLVAAMLLSLPSLPAMLLLATRRAVVLVEKTKDAVPEEVPEEEAALVSESPG